MAVPRSLRAAGGVALAALVLTGCSVTVKDPGYTLPAPLPPLEQLKQAPLTNAAAFTATGDVLAFVTADRNIACALTSARGPHLDLPYEPNNFSDPCKPETGYCSGGALRTGRVSGAERSPHH